MGKSPIENYLDTYCKKCENTICPVYADLRFPEELSKKIHPDLKQETYNTPFLRALETCAICRKSLE
ncbi:MAG: hypothetical protein JW754_03505 [Candidatus Aenigmarchaeota archaeon]|nr:hypothetical protein [Candidatus Aenigmarchaeota archaeon]